MKRIVSIALALIMVMTLLVGIPVTASAETNNTGVRLLDASGTDLGITLYSDMDQGIPRYDTGWGVGTTLTGPPNKKTNPAFSLNPNIRDFLLVFDNQPTSFTADNKNGGIKDKPTITDLGVTGETTQRFAYKVEFASITGQGNKPFHCEYKNGGGRSFELMYEGGGGQQGGDGPVKFKDVEIFNHYHSSDGQGDESQFDYDDSKRPRIEKIGPPSSQFDAVMVFCHPGQEKTLYLLTDRTLTIATGSDNDWHGMATLTSLDGTYLHRGQEVHGYKLTLTAPGGGEGDVRVQWDEGDICFHFVVEGGGQQGGSVVWTPGGATPTNADGVLKTLYDNDYLCPVPDNDVHFIFPSELKRWEEGCENDWDYGWRFDDTTGIVTIWVNGANQERWTAAVEAQPYGSLTDGVYYRFYFGSQQDKKPRTYGRDYYSDYAYGELPGSQEGLYSDYHPNNGYKLAAVNKESKAYKLTGKAGTESKLCILSMDNNKTTMNTAELRYAMRIDMVTVDSFNYKVASANTVAAAKERITVDNFYMDNGNGWEARVPEDGTVFLRTNKTSVTMNNAPTRQYDYVADLTVASPGEGYQLVQWRESYNGSSGSSFPVHLNNTRGGDQTVFITWKNPDTGNVIEEEVHVETMNHATWMELLGDEHTPVLTPDSVADSATRTLLEENGIYVSYDPDLGYFSTTVDASMLNDVSLLERGVTLTVPAQFRKKAVSFKWQRTGGSENPATHGWDRAQQTVENLAGRDSIRLDDGNAVLPSQPFVQTQTLELEGLTVYYTDFQLYDSMLVQWLDEDDRVLGYSYAYGRNGDFNTEVDTECLKATPTGLVDKPTLVVYDDDLEFYCEKSPQMGGNVQKQFFRFSVNKAGHLNNGKGNEVYLPYGYFGMTADMGQAWANAGKHPIISHYTDVYTYLETIVGEYTEYGIKFVTGSFSPFVVDVSDEEITADTPASIAATTDENGVAQISSIRLTSADDRTDNKIKLPAETVVIAGDAFRKLADDNKPAQLLLPVPGDDAPIAITLNSDMLSALASDSNVSLSVISGAVDGNTDQQITAMERLPEAALVLNIDLAVGDVPVTTFAAGAAMQIETKYELPGGYDTVKVYCLKADGSKEPVSAQYSASTRKLVLSLPHLSTYVVEPVKTLLPGNGHSGYTTAGHTITSDLKSVSRVTVDGVTVDSKYYTVSGGNVTLSEAYLKTLTGGKHTVKLENDSYIATGEITVNNPAGVASAKTGDAGVALYVGMSLAAVLGSAVVIGRKKEF